MALTATSLAQAPAPTAIRTHSDAKAPTISRLLTGAQFSFFNSPIKERSADAALLGSWKQAGVRMMRYPGGTWAEHYVWDHPENSYFAIKGANAKTVVSPDTFMEMCRAIGAEPIFQANLLVKGDRSNNYINPTRIEDIREGARWAAGWVKHVNREKGWNVKYWELGNELWIMLRPEEYATMVVEYSRAMRAVDPSIKIIACGLSSQVGPFKSDWFRFPDDPKWEPRLANANEPDAWNRALFTLAKGSFDYLAPHPYVSVKGTRDAREIYLKTVGQVWDQTHLKHQYGVLDKNRTPVRLAVTEWATNFEHSVSGYGKYEPGLYYYTLGNGINTAHYLGQIVAGGKTDIAVMHSLEDAQTLWYWPANAMSARPLSHPAFLALDLWGTHLGTRRVQVQVEREPRMRVGDATYPSLFTFASEDDDSVYLIAINLDPDSPRRLSWRHREADLSHDARLHLVSGPALSSDNWSSWGKDTAEIRIRESVVAPEGSGYVFALPPHSMAGIKIRKGSSKGR